MAAASVASSGASPASGYDFQTDSTGDADENLWTILQPAGSVSSNGAFSYSPASLTGSFGSYLMINNRNQHQAQPPLSGTLSPLNLDLDQHPSFPTSSYGDNANGFGVTSAPAEGQFMPDGQSFGQPGGDMLGDNPFQAFDPDIADNQGFLFTDLNGLLSGPLDFSNLVGSTGALDAIEQQPLTQANLDIPQPYQSGPDVPPWNPENLHTTLESSAGDSPIFVMEGPGLVSPSPAAYLSPSVATPPTASPESPIDIKLESGSKNRKTSAATSAPITIRRTGGSAGVKKKKAPDSAPRSAASSSSSNSSSGQFLIVTPDSVNAHAGRPNPYECFEAARPSQKGRKGPLMNETKENALQVRRVGACFCCHARKVRCDKERPCRNCTKLMAQVPQVMCWQFQDFLPVLFPSFIRTHFSKEEMSRFMADNIAGFKVDGVEKPCTVELFSGAKWEATFRIEAKFFTAKGALEHWHMQIGRNNVDLHSREAPPIALETDPGGGGGAPTQQQRDEIRKKAREYIAAIVQEPRYAEQATDSLRHTDLPRKILKIVQRYARSSGDQQGPAIVKRALSIYAMHYVMTRHLCLTQASLASLRGSRLVAQDNPWVTPRVLNRQIKSVVDEMLMREVQLLFEGFSKSLKPKSRREWAPCLAAFLVLCLFMEAVETEADTFVTSQNEIDLRGRRTPQWRRLLVLQQNAELENLPFRQFAHQFHQIYATHSREANAKSFNPLVDDASLQLAELDPAAYEMVLHLRHLIMDRNSCRFFSPCVVVEIEREGLKANSFV